METISILMLGGRRCGKTTILANMCENIKSVLHHDASDNDQTLFTLNKEPESLVKMAQALDQLDSYFDGHLKRYEEFIIDDNQTTMESHVKLKLQPTNHGDALRLDFIDIPGEWCVDKPDTVIELIRKSQVIVLAIDSPAMLEANGAMFEYCNKATDISNIILSALNADFIKDERAQKLMLFVPLKCEKYAINNNGESDKEGMHALTKAVRDKYAHLLSTLQSDSYHQKITIAITPIMTIKEVRWASYSFQKEGKEMSIFDEQGDPIALNPRELHIKLLSHYGFRDSLFDRALIDAPTSLYCEQPLVYTLVYTLKYAMYLQDHQKAWVKIILNIPILGAILGFLGNLWSGIINLFKNNNSYTNEFNRLSTRKMCRENEGYEILQNPLNI